MSALIPDPLQDNLRLLLSTGGSEGSEFMFWGKGIGYLWQSEVSFLESVFSFHLRIKVTGHRRIKVTRPETPLPMSHTPHPPTLF